MKCRDSGEMAGVKDIPGAKPGREPEGKPEREPEREDAGRGRVADKGGRR